MNNKNDNTILVCLLILSFCVVGFMALVCVDVYLKQHNKTEASITFYP